MNREQIEEEDKKETQTSQDYFYEQYRKVKTKNFSQRTFWPRGLVPRGLYFMPHIYIGRV